MKKMVSCLIVLACILTFVGCSKKPNAGSFDENGQVYFNATVLELNNESVKVECTKSFDSGILVGEKFSVSADVSEASGIPKLVVGDDIRVVFNGDVMESDPLQIGTVFAIYLLDENGETIPNT